MKAAVYRRYGPPQVVSIEECPKPGPKPGEVLVRIRASTISSADWRARSLVMPRGFGLIARPMFGFRAPRKPVLGTELAGIVEGVGSGVRSFAIGDAVFAFPGIGLGCHAEYRTMPETGCILPMPSGLSFEEAAAMSFGGTTALHFLRDLANVRPGNSVLVIGASGAVGNAAVQLARHFGAEVTGVTSTRNVETVMAIGAHKVIDYTRTDFLTAGERYDVIFDTVGAMSQSQCDSVLKERGCLLLAAAGLPQILGSRLASLKSGRRVHFGSAPERVEDLRVLKDLADGGRFRPLIDRTFPLDRIVDAHALVDTGRKRGSVVITMG